MKLKRSQKVILWFVTVALSIAFIVWGVGLFSQPGNNNVSNLGYFLGIIVPILLLGGMAFLQATTSEQKASKTQSRPDET